jgi:hypothetical protein
MTPCTRIFRDSNSSRTTLLSIIFPRFLTNSRTQRSSGREKVWNLTHPSVKGPQRANRGSESVGC